MTRKDNEVFQGFFVKTLAKIIFLVIFSSVCVAAPVRQEENRLESETSPTSPPAAVSGDEAKGPIPALQFQGQRFDEIPLQVILGDAQAFIPNMSLEEIRKILYRNEARQIEPAFQRVEAVGRVEGPIAKVRIELTFTTEQESDVSFPIGFREGVFLDPDMMKRYGQTNPGGTERAPVDEKNSEISDNSDDSGFDAEEHSLRYEGAGTYELTVDGQSGDYVLNIRNPEAPEKPANTSSQKSTHKFAFTLAFPVTTFGKSDQRLKLTFPSAVRSRFVLSLPMADAVPAEPPQGVNIPSIRPAPDGGTEFEMYGLSKTIDVSWREQPRVQAENPVTLQVEGARILVRINPGEMEYEANLPVRAVGGPLRRFFVRLPEGSSYVPDVSATQMTADYQIEEVREENHEEKTDSPDPAGSSVSSGRSVGKTAGKGPLLEIRVPAVLKQETALPIQIRAVRTLTLEEQREANELGGFEVLGAERQSGFLDIEVPDEDLRPSWKSNRGIRIDEDSNLSLQEKNHLRFVFFTQPFSLLLKVVSPQTQISVKPEYRVDVERGQILLKGKMSATIRGAKTDMLQLHLHGWTLDDVLSGNIDVSGISSVQNENTPRDTINLPLRVRTEGPLEWSFTAYRPMPQFDENHTSGIQFELPFPVADRIEPAQVVIAPADNVELPSRSQELTGLARTGRSAISSELLLPPRVQEPLCFRSDVPLDADKARLAFRSDVIVHDQEVYVTSRAAIRLMLDEEDHVVQDFTYDVRFEPLDQITFVVPKSISDGNSLKIMQGGKEVESWRVSYPDPIGPESTRLNIALPNRLIGRETFTLHYVLEPVDIPRRRTTWITIPLVVPDDETPFLQQEVAVSTPGGINIIYSDVPEDVGSEQGNFQNGVFSGNGNGGGTERETANFPGHDTSERSEGSTEKGASDEQANPWKQREGGGTVASDSGLQEKVFTSSRWENAITLYILLDYMDVLGNTVVERAWVQTWVTDRIRVDRAAFRVTSHHESFSIHLPSGFEKSRLIVQWDNEIIPLQNIQYDSEGALVVTQKPQQRSLPHLLDIRYQIPGESIRNLLEVELPHFSQDAWVRRMYWQVILPQNRHLIGDCPGWTAEFQWVWNNMFWRRESSLTQEELELWIGAADHQAMAVSRETSRYLFSSFNPPAYSTLAVVNRTEIVLFCSGAVLMVGLSLIYFPWTRYVGVVFSLGTLLVAILLYHATSALLILQASLLGMILVLISGLLARIFHQDPKWKFAPVLPFQPGAPTKAEKRTTPPQSVGNMFDATAETPTIPEGRPDDPA